MCARMCGCFWALRAFCSFKNIKQTVLFMTSCVWQEIRRRQFRIWKSWYDGLFLSFFLPKFSSGCRGLLDKSKAEGEACSLWKLFLRRRFQLDSMQFTISTYRHIFLISVDLIPLTNLISFLNFFELRITSLSYYCQRIPSGVSTSPHIFKKT